MKSLLDSNEFKSVLTQFKNLDFEDKHIYGNWLAQTYYIVLHAARLLALGVSRLPAQSPVGQRMLEHAAEEESHYELALKDIKALGLDISDFPCFGITKAFYETQYYKVLFEHPYHLMGEIFMLEAVAKVLGSWMHDKVRKAHGDEASWFVKVHAHEDEDHVEKGMKAIESFPAENQKGTFENFVQACEMYSLILRSINEASAVARGAGAKRFAA